MLEFLVGSSLDIEDNPERTRRATSLIGSWCGFVRDIEKKKEELQTIEPEVLDMSLWSSAVAPVMTWGNTYAQELATPLQTTFFAEVFLLARVQDR